MVYTVYIDVLLVIDFIIDYLLLFATGQISGATINRGRIVLAAALGAAYSFATLFVPSLGGVAVWLFAAFVMTSISYGVRAWRLSLIFLGLGAAFGGVVFAINYIVGGKTFYSDGMVINIPFEALLIAAAVSFVIMSFTFRKTATGATKEEYVTVEIRTNCRDASFTALVDSGNALRDPMTNAKAVIVELEAIRGYFGRDVYRVIAKLGPEEAMLEFPGRFRLIPYKTVGHFGFLLAFKPKYLFVNGKKKNYLVAISKERIAENGAYRGIIGLEEE